ncbi:hypothetical protein NE235_23200 [Actinoallomurus spadix]|uniref:Secreted protein n=1 Tax=Actinoallomurus spadix TaxID=79912 RepID=A0ABP3GQI0_9ACTN|nr:hypothetical protein [Actinoallomurus spadix]MCO5989018.1 hypothetical protein [Actinoallomurus spadix]
MAALLVMPAVAFAVLVTILYEDRLLPQSGSAPEPLADGEPAVGTASAVAAVAATEETATIPPPATSGVRLKGAVSLPRR